MVVAILSRPERNVDHSPAASADLETEWTYRSTAPLFLYGMHRTNLLLHLFIRL